MDLGSGSFGNGGGSTTTFGLGSRTGADAIGVGSAVVVGGTLGVFGVWEISEGGVAPFGSGRLVTVGTSGKAIGAGAGGRETGTTGGAAGGGFGDAIGATTGATSDSGGGITGRGRGG